MRTNSHQANIFQPKQRTKEIYSENCESFISLSKCTSRNFPLKQKLSHTQTNFFLQQKSSRSTKNEPRFKERGNPKSLKESMAFMTPEVSGLNSGGCQLSFNCFSNAGASGDSVQDDGIKSHSNSKSPCVNLYYKIF